MSRDGALFKRLAATFMAVAPRFMSRTCLTKFQISLLCSECPVPCPPPSEDASKRRLDTDSEWEALTEQCGTEPRDEDPSLDFAEGYKSPVQKPCASGAPMASYAPAGGQVVIPLPPGVHNVNEWGRTIIKMKKYSDENITYDELIYRATNCTETARYIQWIRSNYTPANEDIEKCKKTQAVDFALYLKKIKWQRQETSEFTRCLK